MNARHRKDWHRWRPAVLSSSQRFINHAARPYLNQICQLNEGLPEDQQLACRRTGGEHRLAGLVDLKEKGGEAFLDDGGIGPHGKAPIHGTKARNE